VGKTTPGRRLPDGHAPQTPGDYSWMPYSTWVCKPNVFIGLGEWHVQDPNGGAGAIGRTTSTKPAAHTWVEHEDQTVSFSPSLVMPSGWHGFLVRGIFNEC